MNALPIRNNGTAREPLLAFGIALACWFFLALTTGLFNGGFLLWDDVIIADLHASLRSTGFSELYGKLVTQDLNIRFRPLALLHYLVMARLYGVNYVALLCHNLAIASLACTFLYLTARNIGATVTTAILFVAVTCLGNQGVFALRVVLAENPGMLFIAVSAWAITSGRRALSLVFFLLAAATKESFVLLAPALFWADLMLQGSPSVRAHALSHKVFTAMLAIITSSILAIILLRVGTHSIGYAGVDGDTLSVKKLATALVIVLFVKGYAFALVPLALSLAAEFRKAMRGIVLCALVLLPQVALYAKSGIFMHYLLPALLWSGIMILLLWQDPMGSPLRFHQYFQIVVRVLLLFNTVLLVRNARDIAVWGRDARMALDKVTSLTSAQDTILIVGHPVRDYEKATDAARLLASDLHLRPIVSILPTTVNDTAANEQDRKLTRRFLDANRTFIDRRSELFRHASCILFMPGAMADLRASDTTGTGIGGMDTLTVANYLIATHGHK